MSKRPIQEDERWPAFARRYANNLADFAREVCGVEVDKELARAFECVGLPGCRVSISSDRNPMEMGVVSPLAPIALWRLLCRPDSLTMVAVPFGDTVRCCEQYGELSKNNAGAHAWVVEYLSITVSAIKLRQQCRFSGGGIRFVAASEHHPEHLAGFCGRGDRDMLWLMENASFIPAACYQVALAGCDNMVLHALSGRLGSFVQGTRTRLSKAAGGPWEVVDLDGCESRKQPPKALLA
ncbi:MAG: hypothetical protein K0S85_61 [Pseudomonas orientalis]|nr:hypothetical protein [Pseudomonas orientalis]